MSAYRDFIDEMAEIARRNVIAARIRAHRHAERTTVWTWRLKAHEKNRRALLKSLTEDQRDAVCELLESARVSAVHDVLAYMDWCSEDDRLSLSLDSMPFNAGSSETPPSDFIARIEGYEWE